MAKEFKDVVLEELEHRYPRAEGWEAQPDFELESGGIVDFLVSRGEETIVVMCRPVGRLIYDQVDQVVGYAKEANAKQTILYIARSTDTPEAILEYAKRHGVRLERTSWTAE